jgi:hypothetical protein
MKKLLLACLCAVAMICSAQAQNSSNIPVEFQGCAHVGTIFDAYGGGPTLDVDAGARIFNYFYVGLGTGFHTYFAPSSIGTLWVGYVPIDVNLKGTIYATRQAVPFMDKNGGGNILNVSSMSAIRGIPDPVNCNGIYTATKFAINGFTECMQKYLLKYNIRVTALCPGSTDTSWWERWTHSFGTDAMLPVDTLADMAEMIVTAPEKVLFKQMQVLPTVEIDNF